MDKFSGNILRKSIEDSLTDSENQRNLAREMAIDFYQNNQVAKVEYLKKWGFMDKTDLPPTVSNLTESVINEISGVYKKPPARYLLPKNGDSGPVVIGENNGIAGDFDEMWQMVERLRNLIGNVVIRFDYNPVDNSVDGKIETEYIPHFSPLNKTRPTGYSFHIMTKKPSNKNTVMKYYAYYSKDEYFIHTGNLEPLPEATLNSLGIEFTENKNPYKIMSIVDLSPYTFDEYWIVGALPLVYANRMLNIAQMNTFYSHYFQAFDQPWMKGFQDDDAPALKTGSEYVWQLGTDGEAGLLGYNPKLVESSVMLEKWLNRELDRYGISANFTDKGDVMSGVALRVKKSRLNEKREADSILFEKYEKQAFNIIDTIFRKHNNAESGDSDTFGIDFVEPSYPTDEADKRENAKFEWDNFISTPAQYLQDKNPDLTIEQAEKIIAENRLKQSPFRLNIQGVTGE